MPEPVFLSLEEVLRIHADQVQRYGGDPGVRDAGLLQSAIAMPMATFEGRHLHESPAEMAAAYLFHIVSNHPFVDGNKRVGAVAARVFLMMNDLTFDPPEREFEVVTLAVAAGEAGKDEAVRFFRKHLTGEE